MVLIEGNVKIAIYPRPNRKGADWAPTTPMRNALFQIEHVEEVGSCGAQSHHIILDFDDLKQMQEKLGSVKSKILAIVSDKSLQCQKGRFD